ncbi:MAG TPA: DNA replication/repair protein RecF [Bacillales bacterium]|nr:DNA replication/repair protein RecF [Bacillales bacterium]
MKLELLKLTNYRNYKQAELRFDDEINVFIGENAQGKTNLLEAIYVLAMANSHRTHNDKELIHWNEEYAKIEGKVQNARGGLPLELVISKMGKKVKANHLEKRRLSDYVGTLNVVLFAPEDLNLVKGSPQIRRRFIDMEMGQVYPLYMHELSRYRKILQQRNALLKELKRENVMLDILTEQLIESAVKIVKKRREFLDLLENWALPIHHAISREREHLTITYKSSVEVSEDGDLSKMTNRLERKFSEVRNREIERGVTLVGPHREDLGLSVNGKDVQTYGSQGQQRTAALSLKLAEIELISSEVGEYPLLLLDDVLSELDRYRQSHLLNAIRGKVQTFVTTTGVEGIDHETIQSAARYDVDEGVVVKKEK